MQAFVFGECGPLNARTGGFRERGWLNRFGPSLPPKERRRHGWRARFPAKTQLKLQAETSSDIQADAGQDLSEEEQKKTRSDALREAEKFMIVGAGNAVCTNCSYEYLQENGDKDFPVPAGTPFEEVAEDYQCPLCGAPKSTFRSSRKEVAGFAVNQGYGFGANSMTAGQKQLLIWGSFGVFFLLFLSGYLLS